MNRYVRPNKQRVRAPRVPLDLEVESRTIGTHASYCLYTEDISRSGLLLVWDRDVKVPFNINTLLELTIDPGSNCLDRPVSCLGKVVRREPEAVDGQLSGLGAHSARLGVQIVQIDNTDLEAWEGCLAQLERKFGVETSNKIIQPAS